MIPASINGRRLTLDPTIARDPLTVQPVRPENTLPCGLRMTWLDGETDGVEFNLSYGVASPYLMLHIEREGSPGIDEFIDIRPLVKEWVGTALAAGAGPADG
jgi:hypothetical protein